MFCEGGEGIREVWDEVVRRCGNGYGVRWCVEREAVVCKRSERIGVSDCAMVGSARMR